LPATSSCYCPPGSTCDPPACGCASCSDQLSCSQNSGSYP
jgi:hypothetical protein